jgi:hypothetical protein
VITLAAHLDVGVALNTVGHLCIAFSANGGDDRWAGWY